MNQHLKQRMESLLARKDSVTLATCGPAGPQISNIAYQIHQFLVYLFVPHGSDHLFNLEVQPELVLLSPGWKLQGIGVVKQENPDAALHSTQIVVQVVPVRLHILSQDGQFSIETIDF